MKGPQRHSLRGTWEGQLVDAQGYQAGTTLVLDDDRQCRGKMSLKLRGQHEPIEHSGGVEATLSDDSSVVLTHDLDDRGRRVRVKFRGRLCGASPHALAAIVGTYEVESDDQSTLSCGVAVFWQFATSPRT